MRIMFFCWAEELRVELANWAFYLARLPQDFIITPLIRLKDKMKYDGTISKLNQAYANIDVDPIYLRSPNSSFKNLLNLSTLLNDFISISGVIKRSRPDVIVCFYLLHAYPLVFLKRILKFSLCVVAMGSDVNLENSFLQKTAKGLIYRNCELIFASSWKLKEKIEGECACNVRVTPSSADFSFFRPIDSRTVLRRKWGVPEGNRVILTVCSLVKNKGVDILIKALQVLNSDNVDLLVVGEGVERKALEELSSAMGLDKRVTFLGFRNRDELLELYNLADLFVLSSYSEGLPRVLIEAMACECVPIATNVGSISAVIEEGYNGFTVFPGDYTKLGEKIRETLSLPSEKIRLLGRRARGSVLDEFNSSKVITKIIDSISVLKAY
jgi:glycosyltransferase involved in cell wall biosynthesis